MSAKGKKAPTPRRSTSGRCVYCGHPLAPAQAEKWPGTCNLHHDLPEHDPHYMLSLRGGRG